MVPDPDLHREPDRPSRPHLRQGRAGLHARGHLHVRDRQGRPTSGRRPASGVSALHSDQPAEARKSMWFSRVQLAFHGAVAVYGIVSGYWNPADPGRRGAARRQLAGVPVRPAPALRAARQRGRLPQVDALDEARSDLDLPLLADELARRAPHVRRGAVLQPQEAGAGDRARHARAAHPAGSVAGDALGLEAAADRPRLPVRHPRCPTRSPPRQRGHVVPTGRTTWKPP